MSSVSEGDLKPVEAAPVAESNGGDSQHKWQFWTAVCVAVITLLGTLGATLMEGGTDEAVSPERPSPTIRIDLPVAEGEVQLPVQLSGTARAPIPDGGELWIVVRDDDDDAYSQSRLDVPTSLQWRTAIPLSSGWAGRLITIQVYWVTDADAAKGLDQNAQGESYVNHLLHPATSVLTASVHVQVSSSGSSEEENATDP